MIKRFASHYIITPNYSYLKQYVIEVNDGYVVNFFMLTEEIESVEWLPGVIELIQDGKQIRAYHLSPFDFTLMRSVGETQRILLR